MKKKSSTMTAWTREEFLSRVGGGQHQLVVGNPHQPEFLICQFVSFDPAAGARNINLKEKSAFIKTKSGHQASIVWLVKVMNLSRHGAERKEQLGGNNSNKKTTPG